MMSDTDGLREVIDKLTAERDSLLALRAKAIADRNLGLEILYGDSAIRIGWELIAEQDKLLGIHRAAQSHQPERDDA